MSTRLMGTIGAVALGLTAFSAQAVTLDFLAMANAKEQTVEQDLSINPFQNAFVPIATSAFGFSGNSGDTLATLLTGTNPDPYAYLDSNSAGLGVCKNATDSRQCNPAGDDNLQQGEVLGLMWATDMTVSELSFRAEDHPNDLNTFDEDDMFAVSFDSGATWNNFNLINALVGTVTVNGSVTAGEYMLLATAANSNPNGTGDHQQYYLSAAEVSPVPLPAAVWLFASALGVFGYLGKRKQAA